MFRKIIFTLGLILFSSQAISANFFSRFNFWKKRTCNSRLVDFSEVTVKLSHPIDLKIQTVDEYFNENELEYLKDLNLFEASEKEIDGHLEKFKFPDVSSVRDQREVIIRESFRSEMESATFESNIYGILRNTYTVLLEKHKTKPLQGDSLKAWKIFQKFNQFLLENKSDKLKYIENYHDFTELLDQLESFLPTFEQMTSSGDILYQRYSDRFNKNFFYIFLPNVNPILLSNAKIDRFGDHSLEISTFKDFIDHYREFFKIYHEHYQSLTREYERPTRVGLKKKIMVYKKYVKKMEGLVEFSQAYNKTILEELRKLTKEKYIVYPFTLSENSLSLVGAFQKKKVEIIYFNVSETTKTKIAMPEDPIEGRVIWFSKKEIALDVSQNPEIEEIKVIPVEDENFALFRPIDLVSVNTSYSTFHMALNDSIPVEAIKDVLRDEVIEIGRVGASKRVILKDLFYDKSGKYLLVMFAPENNPNTISKTYLRFAIDNSDEPETIPIKMDNNKFYDLFMQAYETIADKTLLLAPDSFDESDNIIKLFDRDPELALPLRDAFPLLLPKNE